MTDQITLSGLDTDEIIAAKLHNPTNARKIEFRSKTLQDLETNVLKTDSTFMAIPELDIEIPSGNSRFTTLSQLLTEILHNMQSSSVGSQPGAGNFMSALQSMISGDKGFTLVLDDPLGLCWVDGMDDPSKSRQFEVTMYPRTAWQCMELGIPLEGGRERFAGEAPETAFAKLLRNAERVVVLTGAGVSTGTESGIPAFRTPGGMDNIWDKYDASLSHINKYKESEDAQEMYWKMKTELHTIVLKSKPNPAHYFVSKLNELGKLSLLVTQNIDGMHQQAGLPDDKVLELHGSSRQVSCWTCGVKCDRDEAHRRVLAGEAIPKCTECGGLLKISTILFGEPLPTGYITRAIEAVRKSDLFIVMGTSLLVAPANKLPEFALDARIPVVLINIGGTAYDEVVDLLISAPCGQACQRQLDRRWMSLPKKVNDSSVYFGTYLRKEKEAIDSR